MKRGRGSDEFEIQKAVGEKLKQSLWILLDVFIRIVCWKSLNGATEM
jgi:hypothetical protein